MIYETPEDRIREAEVLQRYAVATGLRVEQAESLGPYDGLAFDASGTLVSIIEVKYRRVHRNTYLTYHIDKSKIDKLFDLAREHTAKAVLIVSWLGDLGWVVLDRYLFNGVPSLTVGMTQRRDRIEQPDVVYHIPIRDFSQEIRG